MFKDILKDLKTLLKPYYWVNIILSLSYICAKKFPLICNFTFPHSDSRCELDSKEGEILLFLAIVVMIRTRRAGSVSMINYLSLSFMYTKAVNTVLWFYADFRLGILFVVLFILVAVFLPEPTYSGPDYVNYFRALHNLEEELERDKQVTWLICFYTAWNPSCVNFAPIFAQLSSQYCLENLKFGKIDIGRYPDAAKKFNINDSSLSTQLPTLILFKEGKEVIRRPAYDTKGKIQKFFFTEDNVKASYDLNNLYEECKKVLSTKKVKAGTTSDSKNKKD
ncbi:unnamed protein product [Bemisia tabaci]|uniref:Thioredoxin domain-containing protein n=1 Tax=Bemisia tabaci TaxID=7038 RepID=A0A9P0A1A2_BEMTA|nr:PREDICTED: thioredoxin-related transmembrane protein 2 homolog [Bemisia tabaci]CAH0381195.1 unnamed protein product [Bemisia tabaci]